MRVFIKFLGQDPPDIMPAADSTAVSSIKLLILLIKRCGALARSDRKVNLDDYLLRRYLCANAACRYPAYPAKAIGETQDFLMEN